MLIHPSSWSNRALRDHAASTGRRKWATSDHDLALRIEAGLAGVQPMFPALSRETILDPPHQWFDAALARQVLTYLLQTALKIPRRQIAAVSLMSREALVRGGRVVAARQQDAHFAAALGTARRRAVRHFEERN